MPRWLARGPGRSASAPFTPRGVNRWQCSPHMTALWSLGAVSLANTLMMCPGYDEARGTRCSQRVHRPSLTPVPPCDEVRNTCSSVVTHFSVTVPEAMPQLAPPGTSSLSAMSCC